MTSPTPMVEAAARALSVNHWGSDSDWRMHLSDARVALAAAAATPAPSTPVAEGIVERLHELIGEYFDLGFAEGVAGRDADTVGGDAQRVWSEIASTIASLSEENRLSMQTIADERERADKAEAALSTARNDAIEEAAKVAEKVGISAVLGRPLLRVETVPIDIAKAIRSLKGDSTP